MTVPVVAHADHGAIQSAHGREQSGGSVALVVVGHGSAATLLQRQPRLRAVQRLDLALLIGAQHDGVFRRIEIKPDDGFQFLGELRIVADFERARQVRLQAMFVPDATHALLTEARRLRHRAGAPVGRVGGLLLRGLPDHLLHFGRCDGWRAARPGRILLQAGQAQFQEPLPPASRLLVADADLGGDLQILLAGCCQQDDASSFDLAGRQRPAPRPLLQGALLVFGQFNRGCDTHALVS